MRAFLRFWRRCSLLVVSLLAACAMSQAGQPATNAPTALPTVPQTVVPLLPTVLLTPTSPPPLPTVQLPATLTPTPQALQPTAAVRFAVIGDYGDGGAGEARVAALVASWQVDFVVTTGDNNYPRGAAETIDDHIGQFYHDYIAPYQGRYGAGAGENRFFPVPGNHDWSLNTLQPYLDYFTLPGNERYYTFTRGPVQFFMLDSDEREPDGVGRSSVQAGWLQAMLVTSQAAWKVVVLHHPPYSSGKHGNISWTDWPFAEWGADAVIAGHDHTYERIERNGILYFVNGLGGASRYDFGEPVAGSQLRYNADYGAMLVEADDEQITFRFFAADGHLVDEVSRTR